MPLYQRLETWNGRCVGTLCFTSTEDKQSSVRTVIWIVSEQSVEHTTFNYDKINKDTFLPERTLWMCTFHGFHSSVKWWKIHTGLQI